ncbi:hypothetical protein [Candidatus Mycobacterium methanotrophicum]|uniref:Uncharacterized protein n=1 Tax=Candidatus Mycobacterium methanotrophicum TaxID=2943498 RepID=A0ABY4QMH8_9MYCO|nr:hypothetical protein [Candidatus Mycobacterium methanotrophicum]UQX10855.1 hypothetical protein M5I08_23385 [Candidatus Mycobacterium methanotrophicum]
MTLRIVDVSEPVPDVLDRTVAPFAALVAAVGSLERGPAQILEIADPLQPRAAPRRADHPARARVP